MAKSFRLDPELERRLEEAAHLKGVPESVLIREAVAEKCRDILGDNLRTDLADLIGIIKAGGGRAERAGEAFKEILHSRANKKK